ncbi:hypothetical protein NLJ89_g3943 [Agrocybe chaxingu]|uniref:BTB domain-containing protein n=1 Tax=Agrocybe chaxingu TaxID=84603 RepID=A0A9W8K4U0_9AGAR|nr:hypothetical protein NLJ89_g3943 [Agrocybe chaxingu]
MLALAPLAPQQLTQIAFRDGAAALMSSKPGGIAPISSNDVLKQDPDLWYDDGNVVLCTDTQSFRVHRSILAARSTYFKRYFQEHGMFPDHEIRLPEPGEELKKLILGIYDPSFFEGPPHKADFRDLIVFTRLGFKYGVDHLARRALEHLSLAFPTSLERWDDNNAATFDRRAISAADAVEALVVLRAVRATWLLPTLFYSCYREHSLTRIMDAPAWQEMSHERQKFVVRGYEDHVDALHGSLGFFGRLPTGECKTHAVCEKVVKEWYVETLTWKTRHPLWKMTAKKDKAKSLEKTCKNCRWWAKLYHVEERKALWDLLPKMYGFIRTWEGFQEKEKRALADITAFIEESNDKAGSTPKDSKEKPWTQDGMD